MSLGSSAARREPQQQFGGTLSSSWNSTAPRRILTHCPNVHAGRTTCSFGFVRILTGLEHLVVHTRDKIPARPLMTQTAVKSLILATAIGGLVLACIWP